MTGSSGCSCAEALTAAPIEPNALCHRNPCIFIAPRARAASQPAGRKTAPRRARSASAMGSARVGTIVKGAFIGSEIDVETVSKAPSILNRQPRASRARCIWAIPRRTGPRASSVQSAGTRGSAAFQSRRTAEHRTARRRLRDQSRMDHRSGSCQTGIRRRHHTPRMAEHRTVPPAIRLSRRDDRRYISGCGPARWRSSPWARTGRRASSRRARPSQPAAASMTEPAARAAAITSRLPAATTTDPPRRSADCCLPGKSEAGEAPTRRSAEACSAASRALKKGPNRGFAETSRWSEPCDIARGRLFRRLARRRRRAGR